MSTNPHDVINSDILKYKQIEIALENRNEISDSQLEDLIKTITTIELFNYAYLANKNGNKVLVKKLFLLFPKEEKLKPFLDSLALEIQTKLIHFLINILPDSDTRIILINLIDEISVINELKQYSDHSIDNSNNINSPQDVRISELEKRLQILEYQAEKEITLTASNDFLEIVDDQFLDLLEPVENINPQPNDNCENKKSLISLFRFVIKHKETQDIANAILLESEHMPVAELFYCANLAQKNGREELMLKIFGSNPLLSAFWQLSQFIREGTPCSANRPNYKESLKSFLYFFNLKTKAQLVRGLLNIAPDPDTRTYLIDLIDEQVIISEIITQITKSNNNIYQDEHINVLNKRLQALYNNKAHRSITTEEIILEEIILNVGVVPNHYSSVCGKRPHYSVKNNDDAPQSKKQKTYGFFEHNNAMSNQGSNVPQTLNLPYPKNSCDHRTRVIIK